MPKVWNIRDTHPESAVFIGRPSKWGNPFIIGRDGTRQEVIWRYEVYLKKNTTLMASLRELRGRHLVCFCAPEACHGDVLLRYANRLSSSL